MITLPSQNPYEDKELMSHFDNDNNFCVLVSFSLVTKQSPAKVKRYLEKTVNRKAGRGLYSHEIETFLEAMQNYKAVECNYLKRKQLSLKSFAILHKKASYLVLVKGHMLAVIDGVIFDHSYKIGRRVLKAWRIFNPEEVAYHEQKGIPLVFDPDELG